MKKVLIFLEKDKIVPKGGPYGYNYNLLNGLKSLNCDFQIDTLDCLPNRLHFRRGALRTLENKISFFKPYPDVYMNKLSNYDIIHFHTSVHMYRARRFLKDYKGKVIFTSHSPMLLSKEMYDDASDCSKIVFRNFFKNLKIIDQYAFNRADYVIFPCEEAEEPYLPEEIYKKAKRCKPFLYMPTGVGDCLQKVKCDRETYRAQYGIPQDAFVFSYVGRHNEVKGYARLKLAAEKILKKNTNVYFLIGGNEKPLQGIKSSRWIEVGYTTDPYSLIASSDIFVLPNLQTYFDLVFLEVISLGKKMIVSETGGNKYFKKYHSNSIAYFSTDNDLVEQMQKALNNTEIQSDTRKMYLADFTCEKFAERYLNTLNQIMNGADNVE